MDAKQFGAHLRQVLKDEKLRDDKFLTDKELDLLLQDKVVEEPRTSIVGYPSYPLHQELSNMLMLWMEKKHCPALDLPKFDLLDEKSYAEARTSTFKSITPLLEGLETLSSLWCDDEIRYRIREILLLLGCRGILDLFGIRKTVGTKEIFPPSRSKLVQTFCQKHSPDSTSVLSVGARALSKHFHRDQGNSWWGNCTGTDDAKNEHALNLLKRILDNAVWINIHWLPHDVFIIEARQDQGYGARWSADGDSFRGFLEPQMIDGHEVGWKH